MTVKTGNPETDAMFVELAQLTRECLDVPNCLLPPEYVNGVSERNSDPNQRRTSLEFIHTRHKKLNKGPSQHEIDKAERARRVAMYAQQVVETGDGTQPPEGGFDYDVDESRQYENELKFCAFAVRAGAMEFED